jgi:hypothetical protein
VAARDHALHTWQADASAFVGPPRPEHAPGGDPGLLDSAGLVLRDLHAVACARLRLAALETQHAGQGLVVMVAGGLFSAGLLLAAWLSVLAAGSLALVAAGLISTQLVLLVVCLLNLLLLLLTIQGIRRCSRRLLFAATLRTAPASSSPPAGSEITR